MTYPQILCRLTASGALSPAEAEPLAAYERQRPFSLHVELRLALYLGVTALSGGLGVLIYQNLDTIGHQAVIAIIATLMLGCFAYVWQQRKPYANGLVRSDSPLPDYLLLLGCLLFLTLEGYLQFAYTFFGTRYGLVTFLPAVVFLPLAYRFDHRGVLTMALTALASWVGLTVAPLDVFQNDFTQSPVVNTALVFGVAVIGAALLLERRGIKPHFTPTALTLAGNLAGAAALTGWFGEGSLRFFYLLALAGLCAGGLLYARRTHSFFFLLLAALYGYVGLTLFFFRILPEEVMIGFGFYYFVLSCGVIVWFLFGYKKILGIRNAP